MAVGGDQWIYNYIDFTNCTESFDVNEADKANKEEPTIAKEAKPQEQADSTNAICQNAVDQEKCEQFADRLGQANENIDKHED